MKIDENYSMQLIVVETLENGKAGDIETDMDRFRKTHPHSNFSYGFAIVDKDGLVPKRCNAWYPSPEEAMMDYFENCVKPMLLERRRPMRICV